MATATRQRRWVHGAPCLCAHGHMSRLRARGTLVVAGMPHAWLWAHQNGDCDGLPYPLPATITLRRWRLATARRYEAAPELQQYRVS